MTWHKKLFMKALDCRGLGPPETTNDLDVLIYILQSLVETHGPCTHPRVLKPWGFSFGTLEKFDWYNSF